MKYVKYTLWVILAFALVFLGLKAKTHYEQHAALQKAVELQEHGESGKPDKKPMPAEITLSGTIYDAMSYTIYTAYSAQSNSKLCKDWSLFRGTTSASKFHQYNPIIKDGRHSITIPLNEHNRNICKYKLQRISLNLELDSGPYQLPSASFPLFYAKRRDMVTPPAYGFSFKEVHNTINIECVFPDPDNIHYTSSPCGLYPVTDKFAVTQYLNSNISHYDVNINFISQDEYIGNLP